LVQLFFFIQQLISEFISPSMVNAQNHGYNALQNFLDTWTNRGHKWTLAPQNFFYMPGLIKAAELII